MNVEQERLRQIGEWVIQTCLFFGATLDTAYIVAGHFVRGLRDEWHREARTDAQTD